MRIVLTALLLTAATSAAQAPAPDATVPPAQTAADAASSREDYTQVPPEEKKRRSAEALTAMRDVLKDALGKLEEARNTRDVVKLNCVNEKLTQIKGLLRISEQADVSMQEALARSETTTADHEFTKVMIARQKVNQLRGEAEECIGQLAFQTDQNVQVEVEVPDDLPEDPTNPAPPPPIVSRPPPASPIL
ncbi:MAG: hypothetical protein WBV82_02730 [Myxococcaceae bacterium]